MKLYQEAGLPKGVLQCIHVGEIKTMEQICQRKEIAHICFTGSVEGGRAVERASVASNREVFVSVGLELGGKDPAYVRADADIAHAAVSRILLLAG